MQKVLSFAAEKLVKMTLCSQTYFPYSNMEIYDENETPYQGNDVGNAYGHGHQYGQTRNYNNEQYPSFPPFDLEKLLWNDYNEGKGTQRNNYAVSMRMKLDSYSRYLQVVNLSHLQHQSSAAYQQVSELLTHSSEHLQSACFLSGFKLLAWLMLAISVPFKVGKQNWSKRHSNVMPGRYLLVLICGRYLLVLICGKFHLGRKEHISSCLVSIATVMRSWCDGSLVPSAQSEKSDDAAKNVPFCCTDEEMSLQCTLGLWQIIKKDVNCLPCSKQK